MDDHATPGPGRPRDPRIDDAVLRATCELLVEVGYTRLSYQLIAERAGVSRPTLYRRWPTKAHIVHDAVFPRRQDELVPGTGDFEHDLRRMINRTLASYARPEARVAVPGLLTDLDQPERRHSVIDDLQQSVRAHLAERVGEAVANGTLRPGVDSDLVLDTIVGALTQRVIAQQDPDPSFADRLADLLLDGLRSPVGKGPRPVAQAVRTGGRGQ
jgi:AcrR family transcriptional regulator